MGPVFVVVPAYNESKRITTVIKDLRSHGYKNIVVIDDGSKDNTGEVAVAAGATVLTHLVNRGQGAGLRTGIEYALLHGASVIVTFDSDGQHLASEIKKLLAPLTGNVDVVLGSRYLGIDTAHIPFIRRVLHFGSRVIIYLFYGLWMTDAHNGFRAFSRKAALRIDIRSNRMEHASEIIGEIKRQGLRYIEVPVFIRYTDETMQKGAGGFMGALRILSKMILQKLTR